MFLFPGQRPDLPRPKEPVLRLPLPQAALLGRWIPQRDAKAILQELRAEGRVPDAVDQEAGWETIIIF